MPLELRDRAVKLSMAHNHLVVVTALQCVIYRCSSWTTPHVFDLKDGCCVTLMAQSPKYVLLVDGQNGIQVFAAVVKARTFGNDLQVFDYDGRLVSSPKIQGMRYEYLNAFTVALSDDTVAVRDQRYLQKRDDADHLDSLRSDEKLVHILDAQSGKAAGNPIAHVVEVAEVALDQTGPLLSRHLAVVDKDRNLFVAQARRSGPRFEKLGTMVHSIAFHDQTNMLAGVFDGRIVIWYHPRLYCPCLPHNQAHLLDM